MTSIIILICIVLVTVVLVQVGRVSDLTAQIKGEREVLKDSSRWNGYLFLVFLFVFLSGVVISAWKYKNSMLGYGPHESASAHGGLIDNLFNVTLWWTGIVFVLTHIALFWFAYKFRYREGRRADFIPHNDRLEIIWTALPAVVMTYLVISGLSTWNKVMTDVKDGEDFTEIEATGQQFAWILRYPGADGKLGARDYKLTTGDNALGQDFTDEKNWDDFIPSQEFYLPVGKKVRVRITAKDVLHNFYLPHFRVKMDAVPGMPTYFIFTPTKTTADYRRELSKYPEYNEPFDEKDPKGPKRWEKFDYELACAELCGKGHYSMRRVLKVVSQEEYDAWVKTQESFYLSTIRGKKDDPNIGKVLPIEVKVRAKSFNESIEKAVGTGASDADRTIRLNFVNFETNSAALTADSRYELDNLVTALNKYPAMVIEVAGHTDNVGDPASNLTLSRLRANAVSQYLMDKGIGGGRLKAVGYGDTKPSVPNDSPENQAKNRRTEFKVLSN